MNKIIAKLEKEFNVVLTENDKNGIKEHIKKEKDILFKHRSLDEYISIEIDSFYETYEVSDEVQPFIDKVKLTDGIKQMPYNELECGIVIILY